MGKILTNVALCLCFLIVSSCAYNMRFVKSLHDAKKTIMKIEVWISSSDCNKSNKSCDLAMLYATGTGAVVNHKNKKTILTAHHVCYSEGVAELAASYNASVMLKVTDRENKIYTADIKKTNVALDLCLLKIEEEKKLNIPSLLLSSKSPEYGERVYNLSAPLGIINGEMVPLFEGHFFGTIGNKEFYSLPSIGGTSGSPILNRDGELVGMVHSVHSMFHHISVSPSYADLWNFLKN